MCLKQCVFILNPCCVFLEMHSTILVGTTAASWVPNPLQNYRDLGSLLIPSEVEGMPALGRGKQTQLTQLTFEN